MRRSKAISPMIAIVLLIAFTVAAAGILITWGTGLLGTTTGAVESGTEYKIKCSTVLLQLKNIKYYGDTRNGLVGYWKFDSVNSTNGTADSSGNDNNGILYNYPCDPATCNLTTGKYGNALKFDGVNDYVTIPHQDYFNGQNNDFTIFFWVNLGSNNAYLDRMFSKGTLYSNGYGIVMVSSSNYRFFIPTSSGTTHNDVGCGSIGTWNQVGILYNSITRQGTFICNGATSTTISSGTGTLLWSTGGIGFGSSLHPWNGTIDDVRIYNRALSAGEIQDDYQYQSFIRGLLLHSGGAESVNNATITAAGGGYVNTTTAFATSAFDPGSGYSFTINTTGGVSTAPDIISVTAKCGNIGVVGECTPGQGCMSSG